MVRNILRGIGLTICLISVAFFGGLRETATAEDTDSRITLTFNEIDGALENPFMGYVIHADKKNSRFEGKLVYANVSWRELEPQKGVFQFEAFEKKYNFDYWKSKGVHMILHFYMDWPNAKLNHMDIPDWLYEAIGGEGTFYTNGDGKAGGFSPNYKNSVLIKEHQRFMKAFAERYDKDPFVWLIKMGSVGHWGEMHTTYIRDTSQLGVLPGAEVTSQYEKAYGDYFKNTLVSSRYPRQAVIDYKMGLHNDAFGNPQHTYDWFIDWFNNGYKNLLTSEWHPAAPDFWKTAPSGGEFMYENGAKWLWDENVEDTIKQAERSHLTWLMALSEGWVPVGSEIEKNMNRLLERMGYRFVLNTITFDRQVKAGKTLSVDMTWSNTGVAPFYEDWPIEIALKNRISNDIYITYVDPGIKSWIPGQYEVTAKFVLPASFKPGIYDLTVAIVDPITKQPRIQLAIPGKQDDLRYRVGEVTTGGIYTIADVRTVTVYGADTLLIYPNPSSSQYSGVVRNITGKEMAEKVVWKLASSYPGVTVSNAGLLQIKPEATEGTVVITAATERNNQFIGKKSVVLKRKK